MDTIMFVKLKTLVNATAFGLALLAGHTAQAVTINAGPLTLDGPPLSFTGDTTTHGYDVYNFTLPYDILAGNGLWIHMETGNANYDKPVQLYSGFDLSGILLASDDDSFGAFGPCTHDSGGSSTNSRCSSIGAAMIRWPEVVAKT